MARSELDHPSFGQESYRIFLAPSIKIVNSRDFVEA
jgi:hypothetical protein